MPVSVAVVYFLYPLIKHDFSIITGLETGLYYPSKGCHYIVDK
jgi:hypothetical protein